jgi:hypothetical protein
VPPYFHAGTDREWRPAAERSSLCCEWRIECGRGRTQVRAGAVIAGAGCPEQTGLSATDLTLHLNSLAQLGTGA